MTTDGDLPQFRLLILGAGSVRTVALVGTRWVIGRAADCAIQLRDPTVSRRQLLLERQGDTFRFQDLGSANPVMLDGKPARQGELTPGRTLTIGLTRLVLERRRQPAPVATDGGATVILSREVIDDELPAVDDRGTLPATAARVLERIEWTFADLGDLADAAEPLLDLARNLTGRGAGWIARFREQGELETLAAVGSDASVARPALPQSAIDEARRIGAPHLLTTQEQGRDRSRLLIPLGDAPGGLLVLEDAAKGAPAGQELLRLARALGAVVWHRLQETAERARLRDELERLRFHGTSAHNALLASTRLQAARAQLRAVAGGDGPVVLVGEPGTEQEDLARYLHAESPRRALPFATWDAARVPAGQDPRDPFGLHAGRGVLARAAGGTLFVDRAPSLTAEAQQRLVESLGATPRPPRLVLASPVDPTADPPAPGWAAALRDRSVVDVVLVPPLRNDARDVLALAELFLSELGANPDGSPRLLTERAKRLLTAHAWPGNTRELRLVVEAAAAAAGGQPIAPRHLPAELGGDPADAPQGLPTLEDVEREHIRLVMQRTGGVRARAAQVLGIAASTLYEKLKKYRIEP